MLLKLVSLFGWVDGWVGEFLCGWVGWGIIGWVGCLYVRACARACVGACVRVCLKIISIVMNFENVAYDYACLQIRRSVRINGSSEIEVNTMNSWYNTSTNTR